MGYKNGHASVIYGTQFPKRIFVGCLPENATAMELGGYFQQYGRVLEAKVLIDNFGRSKRYGFVSFHDEMSVKRVLQKQPIVFMGKVINVGVAVKKDTQESSQNSSPGTNIPHMPPIIFTTTQGVRQMPINMTPSLYRMPVPCKLMPVIIQPSLCHNYSIPNCVPSQSMDYPTKNRTDFYQNTIYTRDHTRYDPLMMF